MRNWNGKFDREALCPLVIRILVIRILEVVVFVEEEIPVAEKNPQSRMRTNNKLKTTKSRI